MSRPGRARQATAEDIPALTRLFADVFGSERARAAWIWKYFDNPFGKHSWVYESADGRIVFHCGGTEVPFLARGSSRRAVQLTDFMSASDFSGGVGAGSPFARTVAMFFRSLVTDSEVSILYGFPGERHRMAGEKLLGYQRLGRVSELVIRPSSSERTSLSPLSSNDLHGWRRDDFDAGVDRNSEWIEWRYLRRPDRAYEIWNGSRSRAIVGRGSAQWDLMELQWSGVVGLREAVAALSGLGAPVRGWWPANHESSHALSEAGAELGERDHFLTAAQFRAEPDLDARDYFVEQGALGEVFFYTLGDYDVE